jgi:hypothetical protein
MEEKRMVCTKCGVEKPLDQFLKSNRRTSGRAQPCGECWNEYIRGRYEANPEKIRETNRQWREKPGVLEKRRETQRQWAARNPERARHLNLKGRLKAAYGLTVEAYHALVAAQGSACAICRRIPAPGEKRLNVDHDHRTGAVRGLLCQGLQPWGRQVPG